MRALPIASLAALWLSACAAEPEESGVADAGPICRVTAECAPGSRCSQGACSVERLAGARSLEVRFVPDALAEVPAQSTTAELGAGLAPLHFALRRAVPVSGSIRLGAAESSAAGALILERDGARGARRQVEVESGAFALDLLPGSWRATFLPDDPQLPPYSWDRIEVGDASTSIALSTPPLSERVSIVGNLTATDPSSGRARPVEHERHLG